MNMNNLKPQIIFALNRPTLADDLALLAGIGLKREQITSVQGRYGGVDENAYMIDANLLSERLKTLLHMTNQESVLFLDNQRSGFLLYAEDFYSFDGDKYIGKFTPVSEHMAKRQNGYTFRPDTNQYFVVF